MYLSNKLHILQAMQNIVRHGWNSDTDFTQQLPKTINAKIICLVVGTRLNAYTENRTQQEEGNIPVSRPKDIFITEKTFNAFA